MDELLVKWTEATAALPWGIQHAFHTVLETAEQEQTTLVYGADYYDKGACLVNQAANMLITGGGHGVPMASFEPVVSLFDQLNRAMYNKGINTNPRQVSGLAAEVLLKFYAPLKPIPENQPQAHQYDEAEAIFIEPTDEELQADLEEMFTTQAPEDVSHFTASEEALQEVRRILNQTPPF